jgi:hypothetical protein
MAADNYTSHTVSYGTAPTISESHRNSALARLSTTVTQDATLSKTVHTHADVLCLTISCHARKVADHTHADHTDTQTQTRSDITH